MSSRIAVVAAVAVLGLLGGCKKGAGSAPRPVPADAKTIAAFKQEFPSFSAAGKGKHVKIHGYAQTTTGRIAITDAPDKMTPFAFCTATSTPAELKSKAHVVAEGTLDDRGDIEACTLSVL
jgi:hypothetical protein